MYLGAAFPTAVAGADSEYLAGFNMQTKILGLSAPPSKGPSECLAGTQGVGGAVAAEQ